MSGKEGSIHPVLSVPGRVRARGRRGNVGGSKGSLGEGARGRSRRRRPAAEARVRVWSPGETAERRGRATASEEGERTMGTSPWRSSVLGDTPGRQHDSGSCPLHAMADWQKKKQRGPCNFFKKIYTNKPFSLKTERKQLFSGPFCKENIWKILYLKSLSNFQ